MIMKYLHILCTILFGTAVLLFFGLAYPHHLHYQEQFQLFLFDGGYVWDVIRHPGGVADLLGRFSTQFFLYAWVGGLIIALLLSAIQLLTFRLVNSQLFYGLTFVPPFLLWLFLLDENALTGGLWAVLLTLLALWLFVTRPGGWVRRIVVLITLPVLYWMVGPDWNGSHYHRYPTVVPTLLYAAWLAAVLLPLPDQLTVYQDRSGLKINPIPCQPHDFPLPHASKQIHFQDILVFSAPDRL